MCSWLSLSQGPPRQGGLLPPDLRRRARGRAVRHDGKRRTVTRPRQPKQRAWRQSRQRWQLQLWLPRWRGLQCLQCRWRRRGRRGGAAPVGGAAAAGQCAGAGGRPLWWSVVCNSVCRGERGTARFEGDQREGCAQAGARGAAAAARVVEWCSRGAQLGSPGCAARQCKLACTALSP